MRHADVLQPGRLDEHAYPQPGQSGGFGTSWRRLSRAQAEEAEELFVRQLRG